MGSGAFVPVLYQSTTCPDLRFKLLKCSQYPMILQRIAEIPYLSGIAVEPTYPEFPPVMALAVVQGAKAALF